MVACPECPCPCRRPARQWRPGPPGVTGLCVLGREPGPGECPQSCRPCPRGFREEWGWVGGRPRALRISRALFPSLCSRGHVSLDAHGSSRCSSLSRHLHACRAVSSDALRPRPCTGGGAQPARPQGRELQCPAAAPVHGGGAQPARPRAPHSAEPPAGPPLPVTWRRHQQTGWLLSCCLMPALENPVVSSLVS